MPSCEQRGWEVVYVDLWSSQHTDPGLLIERAIMAKLQSYAPRIKHQLSTGSSWDKLAKLVMSRHQPFFGITFHVADVAQAFECMGHRPKLLWEVVKRVALELGKASELGHLLQQVSKAVQTDFLSIFQSAYDQLTELQQAILFVFISSTNREDRHGTPTMRLSHTPLRRWQASGLQEHS